METAALASPSLELWQFCRSHIIGLKWNTVQSFLLSPPLFIHGVILFVTKTKTNDMRTRWRSCALIVRLPVGEGSHWSEWLVDWCDGDELDWHRMEGQTWPLRLSCGFMMSAQVDPQGKKKHIFKMCKFYYDYFHFRCTTVEERLKWNKTFTYFWQLSLVRKFNLVLCR